MHNVKQLYGNVLDFLGEYGSFMDNWRWLSAWCLAVYAVTLGFRISFAGRWDHPELWANGERILATHDAYLWLAKAKGFALTKFYPLADAARLVHDLTGVEFGSIGFWGPAVVAALVSSLSFLFGWLLGGRNAGILAGIIASLTPGFFYRSRLGYFDTDMFTLLMPMLVAFALAYWSSFHLKGGWFFSRSSVETSISRARSLWLAFGIGLIARLAGIWHQDIVNVFVLYFFMTLILVFVTGRRSKMVNALYGMTIFLLVAFPGASFNQIGLWPFFWFFEVLDLPGMMYVGVFGVILGGGLAFFISRVEEDSASLWNSPWVCVGGLVMFILSTKIAYWPMLGVFDKLLGYFFPATSPLPQGEATFLGPIFPSVVQSIIEARLATLSEVLQRGAFTSWIGYIALVASFIVVLIRPVAIFLMPLILLQILSMRLGIRFTMFGGAALIICLSVLLNWCILYFMQNYSRKDNVNIGAQVLIGVVILFFAYPTYATLPLSPVIPKGHAEALVELGQKADKNSMVWTWWDWGYATMYYAGLEPVIDGGKHAGRDIFPVAYVMSTDSANKANRMIAFSSQYKDPDYYGRGLSPALEWARIPRDEINQTLADQLSQSRYPEQSPQYLVVSWNDLSISKWITYFGNWNLETGKTKQANPKMARSGQLGYNLKHGVIQNRMGQGGLVSDIDVLDWRKVTRRHYGMNAVSLKLVPKTPYLIVNKVTGQSILADNTAYESMMFRLMVNDPETSDIGKYFRLVVDKLPFVRIYEVVQNPQ